MKSDILNRVRTVDEDRAVSPVVGVALLIAITVILAAVIGFVVLDTTVQTTDAPNARLNFEFFEDEEDVVISHEGGNQFRSETVVFKVTDDDGDTDQFTYADRADDDEFFNTGDTVEVDADTGYTIIVYWDDPQSDRELQLGKTTLK